MKRHLLIAEFLNTPWAIEPGRLAAFSSILHRWQQGESAGADVLTRIDEDKDLLAARQQEAQRAGQGANIAVLPLYGVVTQRGNMAQDVSGPGSASTQKFGAALRQAMADPSVGAVLIDIDSPGGSVFGVGELAADIIAQRGSKPIIGLANSMAASAAYWIGSACSELYVAPGGQVGSIGVFSAHEDLSKALDAAGVTTTLISAGKYKTEGNPYEPLTEEARADMQGMVDHYYRAFTKSVAKGRGVSVEQVRADYGQGRMLTDSDAQAAGMVNGVITFNELVKKVAKDLKAAAKGGSTAQAPTPRLAAARRELDMLS